MEKPKDKTTDLPLQEQSPGSVLEELAREGARRLLAQALELEVAQSIEKPEDKADAQGVHQVVRSRLHARPGFCHRDRSSDDPATSAGCSGAEGERGGAI